MSISIKGKINDDVLIYETVMKNDLEGFRFRVNDILKEVEKKYGIRSKKRIRDLLEALVHDGVVSANGTSYWFTREKSGSDSKLPKDDVLCSIYRLTRRNIHAVSKKELIEKLSLPKDVVLNCLRILEFEGKIQYKKIRGLEITKKGSVSVYEMSNAK